MKCTQTNGILAGRRKNRERPHSRSSSSSSCATIETLDVATERDETATLQVTRDCKICGESRLEFHFVPATFDCQHQVDYCSLCLQAWISSSLDDRGWDSIRCPATECRSTLKTEEIQVHADRETFER
jgi:hypothetical protein